jgi:hypothetical protein
MDSAMTYDMKPEEEIKVTAERSEDLLEKADREIVEELEATPKGPEKPFVSGVLSYPFRLQVFPLLIGITVGWSFQLVFVRFAFMLPFMIPVAAIVGMMVLFPTLVTFQKMFENTANADEESECRPEGGLLAFIDWVGETIPMGLALFISGLPAVMIVNGLKFRPEFLAAIPISSYLLFPLIYVSMSESASIGGIFSKPVWGSLRKLPGTWCKFYLYSGILLTLGLAASGGFAFAMNQGMPSISVLLGALVAVVATVCVLLTIYFRILGRVAYVLGQKIEIEQPISDSDREEEALDAETNSEVTLGV